MRRHLDDHSNLNSGRVFGSLSLPLASVPSSNLPARTSAADAAEPRVGGATSNIPVTSTGIGALPASNHSVHHPNRSVNHTPLSPGPASGTVKPPLQRQPLALIQETVHSVGSAGGTEMPSGMQYSLPSGYQSRVPPATTLSQANNHSHNPNPSALHHQVQPHPPQSLHQGQVNSQANGPSAPGQVQFQRLKVEDALNYLDQVKYKFGNQPQVYNDFLDIMKEFKSQSIDTPGVIQRVSTLFKGHPELIVGFSTFLPPGYRIEVQPNEQVQVSIPGTNMGPGGTSTGPTSLTINPGGTITTTAMHPSSHTNQTNHSSHSNATTHPVSSNSGSKVLNHQPSLTNNNNNSSSSHVHKETTTQNHASFNQNSPATTHSSGASPGVHSPNSTPPANQPVEFNHAINYVNKIKNRFQGQPDIYKQFLEILHTYQKEQRNLKDGIHTSPKPLTESEVYAQVAKLFQNQEDLLQEFGQFLPDANGASNALANFPAPKTLNNDHPVTVKKPTLQNKPAPTPPVAPAKPVPTLKRQASTSVPPAPIKKMKMTSLKDVSVAEAAKAGTLNEFAFFDNVRKALKNQDAYENFLRFLVIYNQELICKADLLQSIASLFGKVPELFSWLKDFLTVEHNTIETVPNKVVTQERERGFGEFATEIDYSSCKKYGTSYRAVPKNYVQPKCSGRTALCKEVLNDTWVSFPSWSEDSTFVSSRKTQYEEYIYRCEDERFELDIVLDSNLCAIHSLDAVQSKINRMSAEEKQKFRLDDTLGGTSTVHNQRAIKRLYGDKAPDVIEGLKKSPVSAVPLVLKRLRNKEEEWRKAKKAYNKVWREQNEKYYLKSLDHMGITFKQTDIKQLRSKFLLHEVEKGDEEKPEDSDSGEEKSYMAGRIFRTYLNKELFQDAANLIIHHVKRQTGIHKEDKQKIKQLIRQFVPDLFSVPRGELSDDEIDRDEDMDIDDYNDNDDSISPMSGCGHSPRTPGENDTKDRVLPTSVPAASVARSSFDEDKESQDEAYSFNNLPIMENNIVDDSYALFYVNSNWYIFLRLHQILCNRLRRIQLRTQMLIVEEMKDREERAKSTAIALRLKTNTNRDVETYYATFLEMIKSLLDGNMESNHYDDTLREMFGIDGYLGFTLDKVIQNIVRQLQHIVSEDVCTQCTQLYLEEQKSNGTGGLCSSANQRTCLEFAYQKKAEAILSDENSYKVVIYKKEGKVKYELLDMELEPSEDANETSHWANFIDQLVKQGEVCSEDMKEKLVKRPKVFLPRNTNARRKSARYRHFQKTEDKSSPDIDLSGLEDSAAGDAVKGLVGLNPGKAVLSNDCRKPAKDTQMDTLCKFNMNEYNMVFVASDESCLYNHMAFERARQSHRKVSNKLDKKFHCWHKKWLKDNVTDEQSKWCKNWLLGQTEDNKQTMCIKVDDLTKPPYAYFNRYRVVHGKS